MLDEPHNLPDGTVVSVEVVEPLDARREAEPVKFPIVQSKHPGSLNLSNERIAELLDDDDVARDS
ncbi:hypothetical protein ACFL2H_10045 [Planctomycetota bacterium]